MSEVISIEILNFLNFGDGGGGGDEKQLVGLRQASGRRQKHGRGRARRDITQLFLSISEP